MIASANEADYETIGQRAPLITAIGARAFSISGSGESDGRGTAFMEEKLPHIHRKGRFRPNLVGLFDCQDVVFRDVKFCHSPHWTLTVEGCEDVLVTGVRIVNDDLIPKDDGIAICNCRNVRVSDCNIKCGDDAIVIKALENDRGGEACPCENIVVSNCVLESQSFALNVGCEAHAPIRNMACTNLVIHNSHRGVGIHLSFGHDIENISFANMVIETRLFHPD